MIAITKGRGSRPSAAAAEIAIGNISAAAALLVIMAVKTIPATKIAVRIPIPPKFAPRATSHPPIAWAAPLVSSAVASPSAAPITIRTDQSTARRASPGEMQPIATTVTAPKSAASATGTTSKAIRATTPASTRTAGIRRSVRSVLSAGSAWVTMKNSGEPSNASRKPLPVLRSSVSPARRITSRSSPFSGRPPRRTPVTTAL